MKPTFFFPNEIPRHWKVGVSLLIFFLRSFEVKFTTFSSRRNAELGCDLLSCGWRSSTLRQLWVVCVFLPVGWLYQRSQRRMHFDVFFRDEFHRKFSWSEDSSHRTYRFGAEGFRPRHLVGRWRKETCFFKSIFSACFGGQYSWKPEIKPKCGRIQVSNDLSSNCAQLKLDESEGSVAQTGTGSSRSPWVFLPVRKTRWWFQIFIFTPTWGNDPIWRAYFSNGLKPPTR